MKRRLFYASFLSVILLFTVGVPGRACKWDTDTLAMEAKSFPELPQIITGRFDRNPPLYYEMRLARVRDVIAAHPENLAAYDDAGVACDTLGRSDEAIQWMHRKAAQLTERADTLETKEHRYRYHANLGTFLAHRWLKSGADRKQLDDLRGAQKHIAAAIAINPDAHFGREKYQLLTIEWLLDPKDRPLGTYVQDRLTPPNGILPDGEAAKAIKGFSGLIVLGNAWESVDVFAALAHFLHQNDHDVMAHFAELRCQELIDAGKRSLLSEATKKPDELLMELVPAAAGEGMGIISERVDMNDSLFPEMRREAEARNTARTEYMLTRLRAGKHPDTAPDFWNDFRDTPPPSIELPWPQETLHQKYGPHWQLMLLTIAIPVGFVLVTIVAWRLLPRLLVRWKSRR
jgi:tetratricopeptide (TPR) repeat protein